MYTLYIAVHRWERIPDNLGGNLTKVYGYEIYDEENPEMFGKRKYTHEELIGGSNAIIFE